MSKDSPGAIVWVPVSADIRTVKRLPDGRYEAVGHDEHGNEVRMVTKNSGTTSEWETVRPEEAQ